MESLNLNTLANSLPTSQQNAEKELMNDFKAAALSITTLYRSSRKNAKRAYNEGYAAACQDLLNFIQQGVSASDIGQSPTASSSAVEGGGMTIGRVMDWTEARMEAIKAREEEEDEEEEREKDKERVTTAQRPAVPRAVTVPPVLKSDNDGKKSIPLSSSASGNRLKDSMAVNLPTPSSPITHPGVQPIAEPSSPSPPPSGSSSRIGTRLTKLRPALAKESSSASMSPLLSPTLLTNAFTPSDSAPFSEQAPIMFGAGAKRRHAVMMMLDNPAISIGDPSSTVSSPGPLSSTNSGAFACTTGSSLSRRRTRSSRNLSQLQPHNSNISLIQMNSEDMDVEEDGRERKRVARR